MAQATWEKPENLQQDRADALRQLNRRSNRLKFMVGGVLIIGSILYLIVSGTLSGAAFFITVDEVVGNPEYMGETVRISGAVLNETIVYEEATDEAPSTLTFTIANIPEEFDNLASALETAINDPDATQLRIYMEDEVMPDLLHQHGTQAIITGSMGPDGVFYATELLLKCPSRMEEGGSSQSLGENHPEVPLDNAG